jgi:hypothetical protein
MILNIVSPSANFSNIVLNEISDELAVNGKVTVVDRQTLDVRRQERNLQISGETSDESGVSLGKELGAHYYITGTLEDRRTFYRLRFTVINIETGQVLPTVIVNLKKDPEIEHLLGGESAARAAERKQQEVERAKPTSNIRDNWVSFEFSPVGYNTGYWHWGLSIGAQYERMFGPKISAGSRFYLSIGFDNGDSDDYFDYNTGKYYIPESERTTSLGIDAFVRYYPIGKTFFLGFALGYTHYFNHYQLLDGDWQNEPGFAITVEAGWKINIGKEGGFFLQPGLLATMSFLRDERYTRDLNGYFRPYLCAGWSF